MHHTEQELLSDSWSTPLYPVPVPSFRLVDLLLVVEAYQARTTVLVQEHCSIKLIQTHVLAGAAIPLSLQRLNRELVAKAQAGVEFDRRMQDNLPKLAVVPIVDSEYRYD